MNNLFAEKLNELGFQLPKWCLPPSEEFVCLFEERFELDLPKDYRNFLVQYGGVYVAGGVICQYQEPTPLGQNALIDRFYGFTVPGRSDNIIDETEKIDGHPDVIAIGDNLMGDMLWLKCTGQDAGHVYMYDHQCRFGWPDEMFYHMYPSLHPEIKNFLTLRQHKKLPKKSKGYEHVYKLATSFEEFIRNLIHPER